MCFSLPLKPMVITRSVLINIVSTNTIDTFIDAVVSTIVIYDIKYANNVIVSILNITSFTNSITGNEYNLLRYQRRTNNVAKFTMQRIARTLLGE